ncbi:hypothetical protein VTO73DRAFT_13091 [Trametes versicolor]
MTPEQANPTHHEGASRPPAPDSETQSVTIPHGPAAIWPWKYDAKAGVIAHAQGCALCDAYLDHMDIERRLGVRSLAAAHTEHVSTIRDEATAKGYSRGLRDGRADARVVQSYDAAAEIKELRNALRVERNRFKKLFGRYTAFKRAHGHDIEELEDYDSYLDTGSEADEDGPPAPGQKKKQYKGSSAQAKHFVQSEFRRHHAEWTTHQADARRVVEAMRERDRQPVRTDRDGDTVMDSTTDRPQDAVTPAPSARATVAAPPPPAPTRAPAPAPAPARPTQTRRSTPAQSRRSSPTRHIPARRGRSPSRADDRWYSRSRAPSPPRNRRRSRSLSYGGERSPPRGRHRRTPERKRSRSRRPRSYSPLPRPAVGSSHRAPPREAEQGGRDDQPRASTSGAPARALPQDPLRHYTKHDAPPFPATLQDVQDVCTQAQTDNATGQIALSKLRFWMSRIHDKHKNGETPSTTELWLQRNYRVPSWYAENFDVRRSYAEKARQQGTLIPEPHIDADEMEWQRYLDANPAQMSRHVARDANARCSIQAVQAFLTVYRIALFDTSLCDKRDRQRNRQLLYQHMAQAFRDAEWYESELVCTNSVVSVDPHPAPYPGPFPPTLDDVVHHAAHCGITPMHVASALAGWSDYYTRNAPPFGAEAQPAPVPSDQGNAEAEAPATTTDGLGAATPGDVQTATTQPEPPSGVSGEPSVDVVMQEVTPLANEAPHAGGVAS